MLSCMHTFPPPRKVKKPLIQSCNSPPPPLFFSPSSSSFSLGRKTNINNFRPCLHHHQHLHPLPSFACQARDSTTYKLIIFTKKLFKF